MKSLVIGGGMSGLVASICRAEQGHSVTIAERNARVGKKIVMSGNGKCNFANTCISPANYNDSKIVKNVLDKITPSDVVDFMQRHGVESYADSEGRVYPITDNSASVVDCLRHSCDSLGVKTLCGACVTDVKSNRSGFLVSLDGKNVQFDEVILACGSGSQAEKPLLAGIVPNSYFTALEPSLTPVKVSNAEKTLSGIRAKASVTLFDGKTALKTEKGEVQFKENGLSGICVFNLSAVIARRLVKGQNGNFVFSVDLFPSFDIGELTEKIENRFKCGKENVFLGLLHNKLAEVVVKRAEKCGKVTAQSLAQTAKNLQFTFDKLYDWSMSQVTAGGIAEKFVSDDFSLPNGVKAIGEVLDVDGECGGYNLFFAIASAILATK